MSGILEQARQVLRIEAEGISQVIDQLDDGFVAAVDLIIRSSGHVIVTGIGKSGLIGRKMVATLSSTGTMSFFLHPVEAAHGDLGMVSGRDVVIALSNSGETEELVAVIPTLKTIGAKVIAMTGRVGSSLGRMSDIVINVGVAREACPLGLAPTASTTAALAVGDALAVCLQTKRGFSKADFKARHPGGRLGERLSVMVKEVMAAGDRVPLVGIDAPMSEVIGEIDRKDLGTALVVGPDSRLIGIITDGDLRRALLGGAAMSDWSCAEMMSPDPKSVRQDAVAVDALEIMEKYEITVLPVVDRDNRVLGLVHLHDLLGRGSFSFRNGQV